jgi:predicted  nucleic acid-binding Zn-ribbon protein
MSKVLKRTGGVIIMIISVLVLLISLAGAGGMWFVSAKAQEFTTAVFAPVESGLDTATRALEQVNTRVSTARTRVTDAQQSVAQWGQGTITDGSALQAISDTVRTELQPEIDQVREVADNARDLVTGVNNASVAVNNLFGANLPTLTDDVQAIQARITSLGDRLQELRADLEAMVQGRVEAAASRVNTLLANLDSGLQDVQSAINEHVGTVQQGQAQVASLKSDISSWITISWVVATIFLLWIAVSQVAMILYGWSLLRSKPKAVAVSAAPTAGEDLTPKPA